MILPRIPTNRVRFSKTLRELLAHAYFARIVGYLSTMAIMYLVVTRSPDGVSVYGNYLLIVSSAGFLSALLTTRTGESVTKFFVESFTEGDEGNAWKAVSIGFIFDCLIAILIAFLIVTMSGYINSLIFRGGEFTTTIRIFAAIAFTDVLLSTPFSVFQSIGLYNYINNFRIVRNLLGLVLVLFALFLYGNLNVWNLVVALSLTSLIHYCLVLYVFTRVLRENQIRLSLQGIEKELIVRFFGFNFITFTATTIKAAVQNFDRLILGMATSAELVGIYDLFKKLAFPLGFITAPFQMVFYPKIVKMKTRKRWIGLSRVLKSIDRKLMILALMLMIPLVAVLNVYVEFMEIEWRNEYFLIFILVLFISTFSSLQWWARSFANAVNPLLSLYLNSFLLIILIVFLPSVVVAYSLKGYALVLLSMSVISYVYWLIMLRFYSGKTRRF